MKTGGEKWKSGADTCVFKPAVKCAYEEEPGAGVSRVKKGVEADRDIEVETRIRRAFPALVTSGAVTVFDFICTPDFSADDLTGNPKGRGCNRLGELKPGRREDLVNMVTPQRGENTLYNLLSKKPDLPPTNRRKLSERAILAAVEMVPDRGPWIIHADCHLGNVLMHEGQASLSDWGRAIVVENVKWIGQRPLKDWLDSLEYLGTRGADKARYATALSERLNPRHPEPEYPQHPRIIANRIKPLFGDFVKEEDLVRARTTLRGWVPYVLINQIFKADRQVTERLLDATSQDDLREKVIAILDELAPPPAAPLPPAPPAEGGMYWPAKYSRGLTRRENAQRKRSATRRTKMSWKDPKAYVSWKTDKVKTRRSSYTSRFHKKCPGATTLPKVSKCTGVSSKTLRKVYNRGMAAWRTGHRPGASQHAWGMARVHSFVLKGKTYRTADADLAKK